MKDRFSNSLGNWCVSLVGVVAGALGLWGCNEVPREGIQVDTGTREEDSPVVRSSHEWEGADPLPTEDAVARWSPFSSGEIRGMSEECCTQPGDAAECWSHDARDDGVLCNANNDCPSGSCDNAKGRCRCSGNSDCNDGVCVDGVCGPSWCNGYLVCSCWGGCEWWSSDQQQTLHDLAAAQGLFCCEGIYAADPITVDPALGGFFQQTPCTGCEQNSDCEDYNPCTSDVCDDGTCAYTTLSGTGDAYPEAVALCPFNNARYASDCARPMCASGNCSMELNWRVGESCTGTPAEVPDGMHSDCYSRTCQDDGTCGVTVLVGSVCNDGENPCSRSACDVNGACVASPLDQEGLDGNPQCCDPDIPTSFDDGASCTDDICCAPGVVHASCVDVPAFRVRHWPNYDASNPGDCCADSVHCSDGNGCTENVCCNSVNADNPLCQRVDWECVSAVVDRPGCCDVSPDNLADNCEDAWGCTDDICCDPDTVAAAMVGDPCYGVPSYHCAAPVPRRPLSPGCCDPDGDPADDCDDGNPCTREMCKGSAMACAYEPQPEVAGCCGPDAGQGCMDLDGNACTAEVCCSPAAIAAAVPTDPCYEVSAWLCVSTVSAAPGCCNTSADCNDGNPCTDDRCVANTCINEKYADLTGRGGCCNVGGEASPDCVDAGDPGNCTRDVCCSDADVAQALPGDDCYRQHPWSCTNPVVDLPAPGCCEDSSAQSDCSAGGNTCVVADCVNHNCQVSENMVGNCCRTHADCLQDGPATPCVSASSCDKTGNPWDNPAWANCDVSFHAAGHVCDVGDACFDRVCDGTSPFCNDLYMVPADTMRCGSPGHCQEYWCDGAGGCTDVRSLETAYVNGACSGATAIVDSVTAGSNLCATDDYAPDVTGRFVECQGGTEGDVVFDLDFDVSDVFELSHAVIEVRDTSNSWDPLIYIRQTCENGETQVACNNDCDFSDTNYSSEGYGGFVVGECVAGSNDATVVAGPWGVEEVPNHPLNGGAPVIPLAQQDRDGNGVRDGFDVVNTIGHSLIVDTRVTSTGGAFDIHVSQESHNNNDCRANGAYAAAPVIDGNIQWKQRWRGVIDDDYRNYLYADGTSPAMGLDGAVDEHNPRQAFFALDIEPDSGTYLAYVDWWGPTRLTEEGYSAFSGDSGMAGGVNGFAPMLSLLAPDAADSGDCTSDVSGITTSGVRGARYPAQLLLDTSETGWRKKWISVSNRVKDDIGDYELTVIRQQQRFFGFNAAYSEKARSRGCSGARGDFDAEAMRLDFVPSGTAFTGVLMTVSEQDGGNGGPDNCDGDHGDRWLVHPTCYSSGERGGAVDHVIWDGVQHHAHFVSLPFAFPYGDKFYDKAYFDTTGRLEPRETFGTCSRNRDCAAYAPCDEAPAGCVCVSEFGDQCAYDPGGLIFEPSVESFYAPYADGGNAPVISAAWGAFDALWNRRQNDWALRTEVKGYITAQTVVFEGSLAYVISWVGMDVSDATGNFDRLPPQRNLFGWVSGADWHSYENHPSWQVILRPDGRIVFYYSPVVDKDVWDEVAARGIFMVGMSGGAASIDCTAGGDAACEAAFGTGAVCDNDNGGDSTYRCHRLIDPLVRVGDTDPPGPGLGNE